MRAIKLKMKAFGPFKDEVDIDFSKFGKEGIFLISGPTGAGKTTIFDAISFALFGTSSGGDRDESMLRFSSATPDIETYVDFTFEYKNKIYNIFRVPKYEREKVRGEGTTDKDTKKVVISLPNKDQITNLKDAEIFIKNLLGVNAEEFTQVSMLAQGDFVKLLKSSSSEKLDLFRNIFFTQKYNELENDISKKLSEIRKQRDSYYLIYQNLLDNFNINEKYLEEFNEVKNRRFEDIESFISSYIKKSEKIYLDNKSSISNLRKDIDDLNILKERIEKNNEIKDNLNKTNEKLEIKEKEFNDIKDKYIDLENKEKELDKIKEDLRKLNEELEKFDKLNKLLETLKNNEKNKEEICNNITKEKVEKDKLEKKVEDLNKFIEKNSDIDLRLEKEKNELSNLDIKKKDIITLISYIKDKEKNLSDKDINIKKYNNQKEELEVKRNEYFNLESDFFESQAGILAKDLKDGEMCPVCGSKKHPKKAILKDDLISEEKLKEFKGALDKLNEKFSKTKESITLVNNKIENNDQNIKILEDKYEFNNLSIDEYNSLKDDLILENSKKELNINELENIKVKLEENTELKIETKEELEGQNNLINEKKEELIKLVENINFINSSIEDERKLLDNKDDKIIKAKIEEKENNKTDLDKYIKDIRKDYEKLNKEYTSLLSNKEIYTNQYNEKLDLDILEITDKIDDFNNRYIELEDNNSSIKNNIDSNNTNIKKLRKNYEESIEIEKRFNNIKDLDMVLKGKISGIDNIRFETFVQMKYLDNILFEANKRLYKMTDGRYSLVRKKEANNKTEQSGLDLEVIDHHNKQNRDINTLSGGESFQAALSLALGLSDTVQMQSGGIELNSMFIDEGFGTLDSESLTKVMSTLLGISKYNKLIGIISHIDVLKEQIDKKIIIDKKNEGYSDISDLIY